MFRPRTPAAHVDALAHDLETGRPAPENAAMVTIAAALAARSLRPGSDEVYHEVTRQRMLRAFERAGTPTPGPTQSAGSRDGDRPTTHVAEVLLPHGGRVLLADVEPIPDARARASTDAVVLEVGDFVPDELS
ncbi:MAG TPA: hypothetical protein VGF17_05130 [Phytomonospora sp.]